MTVEIKQGVQIQLFNAKEEMFEAKTNLKVCLVSMGNMETNNTFSKKIPMPKQTNRRQLILYPFVVNKTLTTIRLI